jgi:hypothetical protein
VETIRSFEIFSSFCVSLSSPCVCSFHPSFPCICRDCWSLRRQCWELLGLHVWRKQTLQPLLITEQIRYLATMLGMKEKWVWIPKMNHSQEQWRAIREQASERGFPGGGCSQRESATLLLGRRGCPESSEKPPKAGCSPHSCGYLNSLQLVYSFCLPRRHSWVDFRFGLSRLTFCEEKGGIWGWEGKGAPEEQESLTLLVILWVTWPLPVALVYSLVKTFQKLGKSWTGSTSGEVFESKIGLVRCVTLAKSLP